MPDAQGRKHKRVARQRQSRSQCESRARPLRHPKKGHPAPVIWRQQTSVPGSASGACRNSRGYPRPDKALPEPLPGRTGTRLSARAELPRIEAALGESRVNIYRARPVQDFLVEGEFVARADDPRHDAIVSGIMREGLK